MRVPTTRHRSTAVRQKQIVKAARVLIIQHGRDYLTIKRVAKAVGITEAAIYRHFKSKRDLLLLLADDIELNLMADLSNSDAHGAGVSVLDRLDTVLRNHISAVAQRRGISFQVMADIISLGDKTLNKRMSDILEKYSLRIKALLSQGVVSGDLRPDLDLDAAASLIFGMVQGLASTWALRNRSFDLGARYAALWSVLREALGNR